MFVASFLVGLGACGNAPARVAGSAVASRDVRAAAVLPHALDAIPANGTNGRPRPGSGIPDVHVSLDRVRTNDASRTRLASLSSEVRVELEDASFARVVNPSAPRQFGAYFAALRDEGMPYVVTVDALLAMVHVCTDRLVAELDSEVLLPDVEKLLARLDARIAAERIDASTDMAPAYALLRGFVAVARTLVDTDYVATDDVAMDVARERARIKAHAGVATSALFHVPVDYSLFAPRGSADRDDARAAVYRAVTWLSLAPFMVAVPEGEGRGTLDVTKGRTHLRAALILARMTDEAVDPDAAELVARIDRVLTFASGAPDPMTLEALRNVAFEAKLDFRSVADVANVVKIDRVRKIALMETSDRIFDGVGARAIPVRKKSLAAPFREALSVRLFGPRATPDAVALERLVHPSVGLLGDAVPASLEHPTRRSLPTSLDLAAWLGSKDALALLAAKKRDAYEGYSDVLAELALRRGASQDARLSPSLYGRALDVVAAWVKPSSADGAFAFGARRPYRRSRLTSALAAYAVLRHDFVSGARTAGGTLGPPSNATSAVRTFVEPHPEAIASLLAFVRHANRGLSDKRLFPGTGPASAMLTEVEHVLACALRVAEDEANGESPGPADAALLATLPSRMEALDAVVQSSGAADAAVAIDVHTDLGAKAALTLATGALDDAYFLFRDPVTREVELAVGPAYSFYEFAQPMGMRLSDSGWRTLLANHGTPRSSKLSEP